MKGLEFEIVHFDLEGKGAEHAEKALHNVYHRGQAKIWNGKEVLDDLIKKHGIPTIDPIKKAALIRVLSLILWGELAAWKTSAALAEELEDLGAKLAATSQAHDEARHFYVMLDYLKLVLEHEPPAGLLLSNSAERGLNEVINAKTTARKLLGMQLMVEPVAITIFQKLIELNIEPILTDLLSYYIADEARHITLGVRFLPFLINGMNRFQVGRLIAWQCKMVKYEIDGLRDLRSSLHILGIDPMKLLYAASERQKSAASDMIQQLNIKFPVVDTMDSMIDAYVRVSWNRESYFSVAKALIGSRN